MQPNNESETVKCSKCNINVYQHQLSLHQQFCLETQTNNNISNNHVNQNDLLVCEICEQQIPLDQYEDHEIICQQMMIISMEQENQYDDDQITNNLYECQFCGLRMYQDEIYSHIEKHQQEEDNMYCEGNSQFDDLAEDDRNLEVNQMDDDQLYNYFHQIDLDMNKENNGLRQSNINQYIPYMISKQQLEDCLICQEDIQPNIQIRELLCEHKFHKSCIDTWLLESGTCPICRERVDIKQYKEKQKKYIQKQMIQKYEQSGLKKSLQFNQIQQAKQIQKKNITQNTFGQNIISTPQRQSPIQQSIQQNQVSLQQQYQQKQKLLQQKYEQQQQQKQQQSQAYNIQSFQKQQPYVQDMQQQIQQQYQPTNKQQQQTQYLIQNKQQIQDLQPVTQQLQQKILNFKNGQIIQKEQIIQNQQIIQQNGSNNNLQQNNQTVKYYYNINNKNDQ